MIIKVNAVIVTALRLMDLLGVAAIAPASAPQPPALCRRFLEFNIGNSVAVSVGGFVQFLCGIAVAIWSFVASILDQTVGVVRF